MPSQMAGTTTCCSSSGELTVHRIALGTAAQEVGSCDVAYDVVNCDVAYDVAYDAVNWSAYSM